MNGGLDRLDAELVHHLDSRRDDAGAYHAGDGGAGLVEVRKDGQQGLHGLRLSEQADDGLRNDRQRALGADHHAAQVVPGALAGASAEPLHRAVGGHYLHTENVVGGDAVGQAVGSAGVLGNVPANGARLLRGRVWGIVEAVLLYGVRQVDVDDPGLHDRQPVLDVDLNDPVHSGEGRNDASVVGDSAAAQACARAPGHDGSSVPPCNIHDGGDLFGGGGQGDGGGQRPVDRAIVLVDDQVLRLVEDVFSAYGRLEVGD